MNFALLLSNGPSVYLFIRKLPETLLEPPPFVKAHPLKTPLTANLFVYLAVRLPPPTLSPSKLEPGNLPWFFSETFASSQCFEWIRMVFNLLHLPILYLYLTLYSIMITCLCRYIWYMFSKLPRNGRKAENNRPLSFAAAWSNVSGCKYCSTFVCPHPSVLVHPGYVWKCDPLEWCYWLTCTSFIGVLKWHCSTEGESSESHYAYFFNESDTGQINIERNFSNEES